MGQIFHATAYEKETKTCCVLDADKFHANCYSYSGVVKSIHYLLRQKAYSVMWGGGYVVIDDALEDITDESVLLGISTYEDYESYEMSIDDLPSKSYYEKVKTIDKNNKSWNRINVWDDAVKFFDGTKAMYSGFLVNHTQKLAVNLADFYEQSKSIRQFRDGDVEMAIDAIPVLTETGGGSAMAFFDGISADTTENLAETWCGNSLQITDDLPEGYNIINCCFADIWCRADYLYQTFGSNADGFILRNNDGELYASTRLNFHGNRGSLCNIKVEKTEDKIRYIPVKIE